MSELKKCEVIECEQTAGAILGKFDVCGDHYNECMKSHYQHKGNEWFNSKIKGIEGGGEKE